MNVLALISLGLIYLLIPLLGLKIGKEILSTEFFRISSSRQNSVDLWMHNTVTLLYYVNVKLHVIMSYQQGKVSLGVNVIE